MTNTTSRSLQTLHIFFVSILFFFCFTPLSHAYFTTAQNEIALGKTGLFTIEYSFGSAKNDISMPINAFNTTEKTNNTLSYSVLDENGETVSGKMVGMVLSSANISNDGMYAVPKGQAKKFILAVFFTPSEEANEGEYRLQVNHLPFQFNNTQNLQLNPSELKYYTTDLLSI